MSLVNSGTSDYLETGGIVSKLSPVCQTKLSLNNSYQENQRIHLNPNDFSFSRYKKYHDESLVLQYFSKGRYNSEAPNAFAKVTNAKNNSYVLTATCQTCTALETTVLGLSVFA